MLGVRCREAFSGGKCDPAVELPGVSGNQYQAFAGVASLDREQTRNGANIVRQATQAENALGRVCDDATAKQDIGGVCYVNHGLYLAALLVS
jgi:hypothetical protein